MNQKLKLRTAINGYNKTDVEEYLDVIIRDYENQVYEYKKRFEEAMNIIKEKDDKYRILETKLAESQVKQDDSDDREEKMQSIRDKVYQLLGIIEKNKEEITQLNSEKNNFIAELENLKLENGLLKEENRLIKEETSKEKAEFMQSREKAADTAENNKELVTKLEKAVTDLEKVIADFETEKAKVPQIVEVETVKENTAEIESIISENRDLKYDLRFARDRAMRLENELNMVKEKIELLKGDGMNKTFRTTRQAQGAKSGEVIEQAGNIIPAAKEEAAKMIRSVSNMYYDAYLKVKSINESIKSTDILFSETSERLEKIMQQIRESGKISPDEKNADK